MPPQAQPRDSPAAKAIRRYSAMLLEDGSNLAPVCRMAIGVAIGGAKRGELPSYLGSVGYLYENISSYTLHEKLCLLSVWAKTSRGYTLVPLAMASTLGGPSSCTGEKNPAALNGSAASQFIAEAVRPLFEQLAQAVEQFSHQRGTPAFPPCGPAFDTNE